MENCLHLVVSVSVLLPYIIPQRGKHVYSRLNAPPLAVSQRQVPLWAGGRFPTSFLRDLSDLRPPSPSAFFGSLTSNGRVESRIAFIDHGFDLSTLGITTLHGKARQLVSGASKGDSKTIPSLAGAVLLVHFLFLQTGDGPTVQVLIFGRAARAHDSRHLPGSVASGRLPYSKLQHDVVAAVPRIAKSASAHFPNTQPNEI